MTTEPNIYLTADQIRHRLAALMPEQLLNFTHGIRVGDVRVLIALASTPSPAQHAKATARSARPAAFMAETETHYSNGEAKNWLIDDDITQPTDDLAEKMRERVETRFAPLLAAHSPTEPTEDRAQVEAQDALIEFIKRWQYNPAAPIRHRHLPPLEAMRQTMTEDLVAAVIERIQS